MEHVPQQTIMDAAGGDIAAFEQIYRKSSGYVYAIALGMVHGEEDAKDITQEVFVTVYKKLNTYNYQAAFKTWLYRITVNRCMDHFRKMKRLHRIGRKWQKEYPKAEITYPGQAKLDCESQQKYMQMLLDKIDPKQRACLILREVEGLSYQEMANTLKININTLRTRLRRARQALIELSKGGMR